jgi:hypothetical protein
LPGKCRAKPAASWDAEARATLLAGLQRKLATGAKSLVANTGYRRFLAAPDGDGFAIDLQRSRPMRSSMACVAHPLKMWQRQLLVPHS